MAGLDSPLFLHHPTRDISVDATTMGCPPEALDALDWLSVLDEMAELESGAIANPDENRQVGHYWLRSADLAPSSEQAEAIRAAAATATDLVKRVRRGAVRTPEGQAFTDVIHVGIGGSALGPQLLVDALQTDDGLRVHFVDNTDPDGIARILDRVGAGIRTSLVVVVSKSGSTPETVNGTALVHERMVQHGIEPGPRSVAITGVGSSLYERAASERWMATLPLWDWVGGRTSLMSAVGLLPAGFAGVPTEALLTGAREMDTWTRRRSAAAWRVNPAALLAGCWYLAGQGQGDRAMVVLPYADRLLFLSRFLQQLVMESLGKQRDRHGVVVNQGLTVYGNKGSTDQHAFVQQLRDGRDDFFATFIQVLEDGRGSAVEVSPGANAGDFLQGFLLGTREALVQSGRPCMVLTVERVDAYALGALIALFERAVGLYASLIDINAYHQPGVEAGKRAARDVLDLSRRVRGALGEPQPADALAAQLSADPNQVFHLLQRLAATGRASRVGAGVRAKFGAP